MTSAEALTSTPLNVFGMNWNADCMTAPQTSLPNMFLMHLWLKEYKCTCKNTQKLFQDSRAYYNSKVGMGCSASKYGSHDKLSANLCSYSIFKMTHWSQNCFKIRLEVEKINSWCEDAKCGKVSLHTLTLIAFMLKGAFHNNNCHIKNHFYFIN